MHSDPIDAISIEALRVEAGQSLRLFSAQFGAPRHKPGRLF